MFKKDGSAFSSKARRMLVRDVAVEMLKIVDGAVSGDRLKVRSYVEALAAKLEVGDLGNLAKRMRKSLENSKLRYIDAQSANLSPSGLPVDLESRATLVDPIALEGADVALFLRPDQERDLMDFVALYHRASDFLEHGLTAQHTLLLTGPPGTGKTRAAHYIAGLLGLPLLTARADGLISSYLGSTSKNIRVLFEYAQARPCVLFLDELDVLAKVRDDHYELGELKRVVISLLQNIDALSPETILVAATNHEHLLDPAVWRRFAMRLKLDEPDFAVRRRMIASWTGAFGSEELNDFLAAVTEGLTGAEIRRRIDFTLKRAITEGRSVLRCPEDIPLFVPPFANKAERNQLIEKLRVIDSKRFTYRRLASIFGVSIAHLSGVLKGVDG